MKRIFKNILPFVLLLATAQLFAQDENKEKKERTRYEFFRERNISKTYPASGNTLNIDGQFGAVGLGVLAQVDHVVVATDDRNAQSAQIAGFGGWLRFRARLDDVVDALGKV